MARMFRFYRRGAHGLHSSPHAGGRAGPRGPQPSGDDRELVPPPANAPPRAPTEAVKSYRAGARNPLKSKVPTAVSTVHVTTALPLWAMPGGLKLPSPKLSTTKIAL